METYDDSTRREDLKGGKRMKPKGTRGRVAVKRLGRTKKTGGFAKIANKAAKEYGSKQAGKKVAAAIYWKKVKSRGGK